MQLCIPILVNSCPKNEKKAVFDAVIIVTVKSVDMN